MKTVVTVCFRNTAKDYYFDPGNLVIKSGTDVIVTTAMGTSYGTCKEGNHEVPDGSLHGELSPVLRIATEDDKRTEKNCIEKEKDAFDFCVEKIKELGLEMDLVRVACQFDGSKILFHFTAEKRVDFRELVKELAFRFHTRIELRQIGVRDEARMVGGLGICGQEFCCGRFLKDFLPVSMKMAKNQGLALNPLKLSGACGRLLCCLNYEEAAYKDAASRMPKNDSFVLTPDGTGNVCAVDYVRETVRVSLDGSESSPKTYHNCELCVLRNGKGSREGIEIPRERPERYVDPRPKTKVRSFFDEDEPEEAAEETAAPARTATVRAEKRRERPRGEEHGQGEFKQRHGNRGNGGGHGGAPRNGKGRGNFRRGGNRGR